MPAKQKTYHRSRLEILNYLIGFCMNKYFKSGMSILADSEHSFQQSTEGDDWKQLPPIGSLVRIQCAPTTKYYLGWLMEIKDDDSRFSMQYLIKSIEDGSLCWWTNISIDFFSYETTAKFPIWKWDDDQYSFRDKWHRALNQKRDAYIYLPSETTFDGNKVTLRVRKRYGMDERTFERVYENYNKVKVADMLSFYDWAVEQFKN